MPRIDLYFKMMTTSDGANLETPEWQLPLGLANFVLFHRTVVSSLGWIIHQNGQATSSDD
jgi:hypothetical protein